MKLIDTYIGISFLKATAFSLIAFTFIWLLFDIQPLLGLETQKTQQTHLYLTILFRMPRLVSMVMPAAIMFGVCFTVSQFTIARELVAIFSAGCSFYRAIAPILISSVIFAILLFFLNDFIVSPSNSLANQHESSLKRGSSHTINRGLLYQSNLRGRQGYYFVYFYDRKNSQILGGINYIQINHDSRPIRMYQAKSMKYNSSSKEWDMNTVREMNFSGGSINEIKNHENLSVKLPEGPDFFENPDPDPSELNIFQLLNEIERRKELQFNTQPFELRLHNNLSFPFMVIVLAIIGSIAGNMGNLRSGGPLVRSLLVSIISLLVYYAVFSVFETFGKQNVLPPALAAWIPTLFFGGIAALAILSYRR